MDSFSGGGAYPSQTMDMSVGGGAYPSQAGSTTGSYPSQAYPSQASYADGGANPGGAFMCGICQQSCTPRGSSICLLLFGCDSKTIYSIVFIH
jgi:hypothetical protein